MKREATVGPRVRVNVTEEHIRKGVRANNCKCPVALAVKSVLGGPVKVYANEIEYLYGAKPLPRRIRRLVEDFDCGFDVLPFSFWLPVG